MFPKKLCEKKECLFVSISTHKNRSLGGGKHQPKGQDFLG